MTSSPVSTWTGAAADGVERLAKVRVGQFVDEHLQTIYELDKGGARPVGDQRLVQGGDVGVGGCAVRVLRGRIAQEGEGVIPGGQVAVFGRPEHDHALEKRSARAARVGKEIEVGAGDGTGWIVGHGDAILARGDLEEAHLASDVVQAGYQHVHAAIERVELAVWDARQTDLADERSDEADVCARIVCVLNEPLGQCGGRERTAPRV